MNCLPGFAILACLLASTTAHAQAPAAYPVKPLRFIVPFPPGGGTDIIARTLGQKLADSWGQPVTVDNRPGSGGTIGLDAAAKALPDGHTIALGQTGNISVAPAYYPKLPYDPRRDFAPVTFVSTASFMLVAHPSVPARNIRELIALAHVRPDKLAYGSSGNGTLSHLCGEMIRAMAGVRLLHVPYKGVTLATTDLFSGRIAIYFSPQQPLAAWLNAGRVRAIGVTGPKRSQAFPNVPTLGESGLPGYEATNWYGVLAPAKTPAPVVNRLHGEFTRILQLPDVQLRFQDDGGEIVAGSPTELAAFINREIPRWAKIVRDAAVKPD